MLAALQQRRRELKVLSTQAAPSQTLRVVPTLAGMPVEETRAQLANEQQTERLLRDLRHRLEQHYYAGHKAPEALLALLRQAHVLDQVCRHLDRAALVSLGCCRQLRAALQAPLQQRRVEQSLLHDLNSLWASQDCLCLRKHDVWNHNRADRPAALCRLQQLDGDLAWSREIQARLRKHINAALTKTRSDQAAPRRKPIAQPVWRTVQRTW